MTVPEPRPSPRPPRSGWARAFLASSATHVAVLGLCGLLGLVFGRGGTGRAAREYVARFELPVVLAATEEVREEPRVELPPEPREEPLVSESIVWAEEEPLPQPSEAPPESSPVRAAPAWFEPAALHLGELRPRPRPALPTAALPAPVRAAEAPAPAPAETARPAPVRLAPAGRHVPPPSYPRLARRAGEEGSVLVRLEIDAAGLVQAVALLESSGFPRLDEAALEALRSWTFEPAREDGTPVASSLQHRVTFRLED